MKGKPLLVAVAAFVIVLIGGAAMAGIGIQRDAGVASGSNYEKEEPEAAVNEDKPNPTSTTTTVAKEAPKEKEHSEEAKEEAPEKDEAEEVKDEEAKDEAEELRDPVFAITHPTDNSRVKSKVVAFGGTYDDGTTVHRGKYAAAQHEGEWAIELVLSPGLNRVAFKGINRAGEYVVSSVNVYYDAPEKDVAKEEPKEESHDKKEETKDESEHENVAFKAHQKYGSCGEEVPYDVFYGTAKPGTKISAISEYGSNSTTANDDGGWEMKVIFPDAPSGKTFNVKIKASTGESKTFSFTNTGGGEDH
ncbi:MAG: hypothetical protein M3112_00525 [Actinomycetia bacterium]|nr:hypothetical protein [Actinomycetes bacterium]